MNKSRKKYLLISTIIAIVSLVSVIVFNNPFNTTKEVSYKNFITYTNKNMVKEIYLTNSPKFKFLLNDGKYYESDNPRTNNFKELMLTKGIQVSENIPISTKSAVATSMLILSILSIAFMVIKNSNISSKKILSVDALDANALTDCKYKFNDIAGNEELVSSMEDIVDFLKNPEKYEKYGAKIPRGVLLYGEPGTGKTLMAKAVAGEAGVPFYALSGSDFVQVYVGVGASRIRQLFKKAKNQKSAIIFIDEIDAIGKKRDGSKAGGSDERDQTLNALLTEMSGFNEKQGIVVMAATNRLDILDEALLRPGRFDRLIEVPLPDVSAREKIINLYLEDKPTANINVANLAQITTYFSGAKIESLANEAAILACKENSDYITDEHFEKAFSIVVAGYEKENKSSVKTGDKKITAYHEAGHAILINNLLPDETISKITIIPSTKGAGGYTLSIPEDKAYHNSEYLRKRIMVLLGGRAAEEIMFGVDKITTGAHNDLKQCTKIACSMITQYGMGNTLGLLNLEELINFNLSAKPDLTNECKDFLDDLYNDVKFILINRKKQLEELTSVLLTKETLNTKDISSILN